MKKSGKVKLFVVLIFVAAGVGGFFLARNGASGGDKPNWKTVSLEKGDVAYTVTASGTLSPLVTVNVGSQVSGTLKSIYVDYNSEVKKGQLIAEIDPRLIEFDVLRQKAAVKTARAQIAQAKADLFDKKQKNKRIAALLEKKLTSEMDADSAKAAQKSAEASLQAAKANVASSLAALKQARTNLGYTKIVSPIDGVVISREIDAGQTVAASFQAPTLFQIAEDLRRMEVHTSLAESDVGLVHDGMDVEFTVDAYPDRTFRGTVKQLRYSPTTVQNVVTYDAVVSVDNKDLLLRPGMTADVNFIISAREDVLLVPNTVLRFKPPVPVETQGGERSDKKKSNLFQTFGPPRGMQERSKMDKTEFAGRGGGKRVVYMPEEDGSLKSVNITTGITDGRVTEVLSGLSAGNVVVQGSGKSFGKRNR